MRLLNDEILERYNLLFIGSGEAFLAESRTVFSSIPNIIAYLSAAGVALAFFIKLAFVDEGA